MPSRRRFLRHAGAGLAITSGFASALTPRALAGQGIGNPVSPSSLPPSVAALQSLKDRAKPITTEERRARIEQARRLMVEHQIDALMLMGGVSLVYFTNIHWWSGERLFALILPAKGRTFFVCPAFERERAEPGMTQHQLQQFIVAAYSQLGFPGGVSVNVGQYSALPHGSVQPQTIHEGEIVMIDDGCLVEGYFSDITRTFVLGKPTDEMRRVFDIVRRAQKAALETARPGAEAQAVDAAARKVITDAGYGPDYKYFKHRLGHGMGMDGHEWPYLVRGDTIKLEPNMMFSDEPGIYIHGKFGIRLEDDMHVTENGAELFTGQSASLEQPFAQS